MIDGLSTVSSLALTESSDRLRFRRGELVYSEGEQATGAYIVMSGKLKLVATSPAVKALILRVAKPGDIIGLSAALTSNRNDNNAVVLEPAELGRSYRKSYFRKKARAASNRRDPKASCADRINNTPGLLSTKSFRAHRPPIYMTSATASSSAWMAANEHPAAPILLAASRALLHPSP